MELVVALVVGRLAGQLLLGHSGMIDFVLLGMVGSLTPATRSNGKCWLDTLTAHGVRAVLLGCVIYGSVAEQSRLLPRHWDGVTLNPRLVVCASMCAATYYLGGLLRRAPRTIEGGATRTPPSTADADASSSASTATDSSPTSPTTKPAAR